MVNVTILDSQKVHVSLSPVSAAGNPTTIDGAVSVVSSDESVVTVANLSLDGLEFDLVATNPTGTAQVTLSGDAKAGDEVGTITDVINVTVLAGEAAGFSPSLGTPEAK